jgi:hypothetical protein
MKKKTQVVIGTTMSSTKPDDSINFDGHRNFGLTKLEYFAAAAMQGLLANSYNDGVIQPLSTANSNDIAEMSVQQAMKLIKYLNLEIK